MSASARPKIIHIRNSSAIVIRAVTWYRLYTSLIF